MTTQLQEFVPGYYPQGKDWWVRFSPPNAEGLMFGQIIRNGEVIATSNEYGTVEELASKAEQHMQKELEDV